MHKHNFKLKSIGVLFLSYDFICRDPSCGVEKRINREAFWKGYRRAKQCQCDWPGHLAD